MCGCLFVSDVNASTWQCWGKDWRRPNPPPKMTFSPKIFFWAKTLVGYSTSIYIYVCVAYSHAFQGSRTLTPNLIDLHLLPVCHHIDFKWCVLVFKWLQIDLPPYFRSGRIPYFCIINTMPSNPSNGFWLLRLRIRNNNL